MSRAPREVVRPEERAGGDADKYYDRGVTEAYTELNVQTQSELTTRCLDMLCLEDDAREEVLLDIGCGSGLSGETLTRHGYRAWVGIDASAAMLERATRGRSAPKRTADEKERRGRSTGEDPPARGAVLRGDFSQGLPFRAGAFDGCVSVSAAQWLCAGTESTDEGGGNENDETLRRFFARLRFALRPGARAALQVYPKTVRETAAFEAAIRRVEHLTGVAVVAFPHENKSKKLFVCARRDDDDEERARASGKQTGTRSPPRCLLAWPHAATCEAAWHDYVTNAEGEAERSTQKNAMKRATRARSDREHVAAQRRALRSLRRARVAAYASRAENAGTRTRTRTRGADVSSTFSSIGMLAPFDAAGPGGTATETFDAEEDIARDGSVCPCARVGVVARARVRVVAGLRTGAPKSERTDGERIHRVEKTNRVEKTSSRLEHPLRLTALGAPRRVEMSASRECVSVASVAFQEFVLETPFGDFGVFAAEAEARTRRERAARSEEDSRVDSVDSDSAHQENAGIAVLSRARAALDACLGGAGSVVCAAVLSRSSDAEGADGGAPEKEASQAWVLWWPSRDVGGTSAEPRAGFRETSGLGESVRDAFSDASFGKG